MEKKDLANQMLDTVDWEKRMFDVAKEIFALYKRNVIEEGVFSSPSDKEMAEWSIKSAVAFCGAYMEYANMARAEPL